MLPFPAKLQALTTEYGQLQQGKLSPQQRGQRFNAFIAEMLQAWGIPATANQRGAGEIDVAFDLNGRSFLIEAKWEQTPTNINPIAKLQKRLRQRLAGTIGVVLSMEGYTDDALRDIKDGDPLTVLLLTRTHLEAMLSGFIRPHEVFGGVLRRATVQGDVLVEDMQLLFESSQDTVAPLYGQIPGISSPVAIALSRPSITATTLISNLPFGQHGIVEQTPDQCCRSGSRAAVSLRKMCRP